jgi:hypothetical protein
MKLFVWPQYLVEPQPIEGFLERIWIVWMINIDKVNQELSIENYKSKRFYFLLSVESR